jgi:uncharacterized protein (TIGR02145 family)
MKLNVIFYFLLLTFLIISIGCKDNSTDPEIILETGAVEDINGHVYKTIKIGDQWWMAENLQTKYYQNGDAIPYVTDDSIWINLRTGAFCHYDNDNSYVATYGRLYNWYAVNDYRNIAPIGWHIPNDSDWQILIDYLGGESVAGGKMKEIGTEHWDSPNTGATNLSGFFALPGGFRSFFRGVYGAMGYSGDWWSASIQSYINAPVKNFSLNSNSSSITNNNIIPIMGYSVRCVKND